MSKRALGWSSVAVLAGMAIFLATLPLHNRVIGGISLAVVGVASIYLQWLGHRIGFPKRRPR